MKSGLAIWQDKGAEAHIAQVSVTGPTAGFFYDGIRGTGYSQICGAACAQGVSVIVLGVKPFLRDKKLNLLSKERSCYWFAGSRDKQRTRIASPYCEVSGQGFDWTVYRMACI